MGQYFGIGNKEKNNLTLVKEVELEEFHDYFHAWIEGENRIKHKNQFCVQAELNNFLPSPSWIMEIRSENVGRDNVFIVEMGSFNI